VNLTDSPIGLAVTSAGNANPVVQVGVKTSLTIALVNNSGAAIPLTSGAQAATFGVYLPSPKFFTLDQLRAIQVTADGWTGTLDAANLAITISCAQAGTWAVGQTLTFTLNDVLSEGPPGTDSVTIVPSNMTGDVPFSLDAPLAVANPPKPGNLQLPDVLQVTLDSQGSVLRSKSSTDPLSNTLYLTLKNIGATALATAPARVGNPQVHVSFVYGNTSGSLAPDTFDPAKGPQQGSAWNITVSIASAQVPWTGANPRPDGEDPHPQWTLTPSPNNLPILEPAASDQANATFAFSDVVSITPAGHTQMFVLCTGFAKDAGIGYDDHLFVLDIVKLDAPPTRGLLSFFGPNPVIAITDPTAQVKIPLRWTMFDVASVQLLSSSPAVPQLTRKYATPPKPLDYDDTTVTVPAPPTSEALFLTLQAFDAGSGYLNSQQFTAYLQVSYVIDRGGHVYPIALFGSTFWMLENYRYPATGSYDYGDDPANEATFGRLYDPRAQPPDGWSLPTVADWNALLNSFGDAAAAYSALIDGGRSGFKARLGGQRGVQPDGSGIYQDMFQYGYYWAGPGNVCAQFSRTSGRALAGAPIPDQRTVLSVRFIRHA
jgi:uncharacterized protein (TIGR02145 family)